MTNLPVSGDVLPAPRRRLAALLDGADVEVTTISVTAGETINLGNYSNRRLDIRLGATVAEGADHELVALALQEEAAYLLGRRKAYEAGVRETRDWLNGHRSAAALRLKVRELEGDASLDAEDQSQLLVVARGAWAQAAEREARQRADREHDLTIAAALIEAAQDMTLDTNGWEERFTAGLDALRSGRARRNFWELRRLAREDVATTASATALLGLDHKTDEDDENDGEVSL